ncbi:YciI family protein [Telmatospirillum sp. J64-1]|uniref:YciI family protein n=1 Tax=Telmatospirillum sp. J64-1 TaxID=2502183 RepID=UPI00115F1C6E|nr:YciI family protein [Telmatospirillum sp. J64-1]
MFIIYCVDKPGHGHVRAANRDAHLAYMRTAGKTLVIGGPMLSDDGSQMLGSMLVLDLPDRAAVEAFLAEDPYAKADLFESVVIRRYRKVFPEA